jgi:hypothetical protein
MKYYTWSDKKNLVNEILNAVDTIVVQENKEELVDQLRRIEFVRRHSHHDTMGLKLTETRNYIETLLEASELGLVELVRTRDDLETSSTNDADDVIRKLLALVNDEPLSTNGTSIPG